jgi:Na+-transporting NADH:ubiquinone oxidoreductase subunit NqrC
MRSFSSLNINNSKREQDMQTKIMLNVAVVLFLLANSVFAMEGYNINDKMMQMKADLNLTDDQMTAVKPIVEYYMRKMEAIEKQKEDRLSKLLSDDQMMKMMQMKKDRMIKEDMMKDDNPPSQTTTVYQPAGDTVSVTTAH